MFRLMLAMMGLLVSSALDAAGGGSGAGGGEGGSGEGGGTGGGGAGGSGGGGDETFTLSASELTNRTNTAASEERNRLAGLLGIDPDKFEDAKAWVEAGRKTGDAPAGDDKPAGDKSGDGDGEGKTIEDRIAAILKPFTDRLEGIETKEQQREQQAQRQTRSEKISEALTGAGAREDKLDQLIRYAGTYDVKVNDKGELEGSEAAIAGVKEAFPEAFRGEGDDGKAADATNRDGKPKPKSLREAVAAKLNT